MKRWEILNKLKVKSAQQTVKGIIYILLENRGLNTKKEIESFLNPKLTDITLDAVGIDKTAVKKTVDRIFTAINTQEQVIIYGDYDVDGLTASAILWETLFSLKANVKPYIPHRLDEGYGLSIKGIDSLLTQYPETKLIITVDNGIVANIAVDYANQKGIQVIITDHHVKSDILPNALHIVHTTSLCGAGIAYVLAKEIIRHSRPDRESKSTTKTLDSRFRGNDNHEDNHLELAALGTIADLVPLKNANRIIVKYGLEKLTRTKRAGLLALFNESGIMNGSIGSYEVGHIIAPRLNATGRMNTAMDSLRLLCTKDFNRAQQLASLLGATNKERQSVMMEAVKHATLSVHDRSVLKKLLVVTDDSYPEGVIGLVAGRLVEEFYRPSIVISKGKKISKGSVRSINGFNIIEFLRQSSEYFINIGGHPMAAGFTIETNKIEKMTEALENFAHEIMKEDLFIRTIKIDCEIPLDIIDDVFFSSIQALSPFGMGNPEPAFLSKNLIVKNIKLLGKDGKHLRLSVSQKSTVIEAIAFGFGEQSKSINAGDIVDIVYTVDENKWNGIRKLQLKVKDIVKTKN